MLIIVIFACWGVMQEVNVKGRQAKFTDASGGTVNVDYDLLLGADGVNSKVRLAQGPCYTSTNPTVHACNVWNNYSWAHSMLQGGAAKADRWFPATVVWKDAPYRQILSPSETPSRHPPGHPQRRVLQRSTHCTQQAFAPLSSSPFLVHRYMTTAFM
jgi:2-polyprenyl-6-methoxyphenol hydroxylase-like FAD-dependent oxidoreductase